MLTKYWESNDKGSNADKVQDHETSLLVSNKADKTAKENYDVTRSGRTTEVPGAFRCILSGAIASVGGF